MRTRVDPTFLDEMVKHALRFTCTDCVYFLPERGCAHFWPNDDHRRPPDAGDLGKDVVFCKEFDLG